VNNTDLVLQKSVTVNNVAASNGGRMSFNQVTSNVLNNMFDNVTQSELTNGVTRYRKFFSRNKNASLETASNSRIWISRRSTGGDYYRIKAGTNTDVQTDAEGYSNWLGTGYLNAVLAVDSTSFSALFDTNDGVYNGSRIRLSDSSGGEEFLTVRAAAGVSWNGNIATIHVTSQVRSTYPASQNSLVSGVVDLGDLVASADTWVETSVSGTYDEATYPVVVNNVGSVEDTWTLTFDSPTTFTVTGTNIGSIGAGGVGSDFSPVNGNVGTGDYYFTISAAGWGGTWAIGETVTFSTHHGAAGLWAKEIVPALTGSYTNSQFRVKLYAEGS